MELEGHCSLNTICPVLSFYHMNLLLFKQMSVLKSQVRLRRKCCSGLDAMEFQLEHGLWLQKIKCSLWMRRGEQGRETQAANVDEPSVNGISVRQT